MGLINHNNYLKNVNIQKRWSYEAHSEEKEE